MKIIGGILVLALVIVGVFALVSNQPGQTVAQTTATPVASVSPTPHYTPIPTSVPTPTETPVPTPKGLVISGTTVDAVTGQPVSKLSVGLWKYDHLCGPSANPDRPDYDDVTGTGYSPAGGFNFAGLQSGTYILTVSVPRGVSYQSNFYKDARSCATAEKLVLQQNMTLTVPVQPQ